MSFSYKKWKGQLNKTEEMGWFHNDESQRSWILAPSEVCMQAQIFQGSVAWWNEMDLRCIAYAILLQWSTVTLTFFVYSHWATQCSAIKREWGVTTASASGVMLIHERFVNNETTWRQSFTTPVMWQMISSSAVTVAPERCVVSSIYKDFSVSFSGL